MIFQSPWEELRSIGYTFTACCRSAAGSLCFRGFRPWIAAAGGCVRCRGGPGHALTLGFWPCAFLSTGDTGWGRWALKSHDRLCVWRQSCVSVHTRGGRVSLSIFSNAGVKLAGFVGGKERQRRELQSLWLGVCCASEAKNKALYQLYCIVCVGSSGSVFLVA